MILSPTRLLWTVSSPLPSSTRVSVLVALAKVLVGVSVVFIMVVALSFLRRRSVGVGVGVEVDMVHIALLRLWLLVIRRESRLSLDDRGRSLADTRRNDVVVGNKCATSHNLKE